MNVIPKRRDVLSIPSFYDLSMVVFGLQKTGKTSFLSGDVNCVTVACEPGSDFIASRPVKTENFSKFREILKEVNQNPSAYSGLVIDTVDVLYEQCFDYVCENQGIDYPPRNDFGRTFRDINKTWTTALTFAYHMIPLRFVSHAESIEAKRVNDGGLTEEFLQTIQRFRGKKSLFLDSTVNCVGYMSTTMSGKRTITFAQSAHIAAGDRTGILEGMGTIELPAEPSHGFRHVADLYEDRAIELGYTVTKRFEE